MSAGADGGSVNIPSCFISLRNGQALKTYLDSAAVTISFPSWETVLPGEGSDAHNRLDDFSSRGPTLDQRFKPDIVCPGGSIRSALSLAQQCSASGVVEMSGTSMATPSCAGASALVRQYFREGYHIDGVRNPSAGLNATAALIKAVMIHSGRPVYILQGGLLVLPQKVPDRSQGYGRVDLLSVLRFEESGFNLSVWNKEQVSDGGSRHYCLVVNPGASRLRVTVVWTDPPGTLGSNRILINDLDLSVVTSDSAFYYGNVLTQWSEAHGSHAVIDNLNNVEQVTLELPTAGTYRIRVDGADVPLGPQYFAMVVTGSYSWTEACSKDLVCPSNCSGHGSCSLGRCDCAIAYAGLDCSLMNAMLQCGQPYDIELSVGGTSLYLLQLAGVHSLWNLSLAIKSGMIDFSLAYNRIPYSYDLDLEAVRVNTSTSFSCGASCWDQFAEHKSVSGTWVLRVAAHCCSPIKITAILMCADSQQLCDEGYFLDGSNCLQCNTSACPVGQYRGDCSAPFFGKCKSCSTKPDGAAYITAGIPYNQDSCEWSCDEGKVFLGGTCVAPTITSNRIGITHPGNAINLPSDLDPKISTRTKEKTALLSSPSLQGTMLTSSYLVSWNITSITSIDAGSLYFSVVLPMTRGEFSSMESKYITAVAAAANCSQEQVRVQAVHDYFSLGRRLQMGAIEVDTVIRSQQNTDQSPTLLISAELLDQNLKLQGLPPTLSLKFNSGLATSFATHLMTSKIMASPLSSNSTDGTMVPVQQPATAPNAGAVAGAVAGGCLLVILGGFAFVRYRRSLFPPGGRVDAPTAAHSNEVQTNAGSL